jgi:hypothetical protein
MIEPECGTVSSPPRSILRRKTLLLSVATLSPILFIVAGWLYLHVVGDSRLTQALAEADRLDPGWRLPDIEARRAAIPDAENGMVLVLTAHSLLPKPWPQWPVDAKSKSQSSESNAGYVEPNSRDLAVRAAIENSFNDLELPRQLNDIQIRALRAEFKRANAAVVAARKLEQFSRGWAQVNWAPDFISTVLPHLQKTRELANLLGFDALLQAQENNPGGALASCRATLSVGRTIGEEPTLISQLVRVACRTVALRKVERVLAHTEPSDAALLLTQRALEQEAEEPLMLYGMRGERVSGNGLLLAIENGQVTMGNLRGLWRGPGSAGGLIDWQDLNVVMLMASPRIHRATLLHFTNELVELSKLPAEEQHAAFVAQATRVQKDSPFIVRTLAPAFLMVEQAVNRSRAELRAAALAVAAERFRRANGRWPESL